MHRKSAQALSGVAALFLGFGSMQLAINRHTPAGHRDSPQTISAAYVQSASELGSEETRQLLAEIGQREAERLETQRLAALAREAEEAAEAERVAEAERQAQEDAREAQAAAQRAEAARRAAQAVKVTPTTARAAPVAPTPRTVATGGNTSGVDIDCESGGNYATNTGNGYYGAYQWLPSTFDVALGQALSQGRVTQATHDQWSGVRPDRVPAGIQDTAAAAHVAAGYRGAWPNC